MSKRPLSMACLAMILMIFLGIKLAGTSPSYEEEQEGEYVTVTGKVYQKETTEKEGVPRLTVYLSFKDTNRKQNVICYLLPGQKLPELGSVVTVKGRRKNFEKPSNPGQFDAKSYYQILKISYRLNQTQIITKSKSYHKVKELLYQLKQKWSKILEDRLPEEEASVMKAMLLGEKGSLDRELKGLYQRSGIAHVLAISGLHISLLGMGIYRMLKKCRLPAAAAVVTSMVIMVFYGFMTGFAVSSLRAVMMFSLQMIAKLFGRTYDLITAAFVAAVLILLDQPLYLYHSGFLFSFGCVFAIAFLVPALTTDKGKKRTDRHWLIQLLLSSGALTMATLPLSLWFFYQLPLYSVLLNLLVIPLMSFLVAGGMILLVAGGVGAAAAGPVAMLVMGVLTVYEKACLVSETLPMHLITPGKPELWQLLLYLSAILLVLFFHKKISLRVKWAMVLCSAALLFLPNTGDLKITFLDVGQGDCIHIKSEEGRHYLIDGGSSSVEQVGTYRILPYLKSQGAAVIQAVFVTHPDADHYNGIEELLKQGRQQGIQIKRLLLPDVAEAAKTAAYHSLEQSAAEAGIPVGYISRGQALSEKNWQLRCMHPGKGFDSRESNELSTVLLLQYGSFQALFTGDITGVAEERMLAYLEKQFMGRITLLKTAHHGSAYSTPEELFKQFFPVYSIISCGRNNSYGHPHQELLDRMEKYGAKVYITYESGAITIETDGKKLYIHEFLNPDNE